MASQPRLLLSTSRFDVVETTQPIADGKMHTKAWIRHPGAVTIVPILDDGRVCLIRNQRVAVGDTLVELPAGTLDKPEDPAATAHRELIEETGYRAGKMTKLCEFFTSPGIMSERMHLFVATELVPGPSALEAGEQIENLVVPWSEAIEMAMRGEIRDAKSLAGLLYYDRIRNVAR